MLDTLEGQIRCDEAALAELADTSRSLLAEARRCGDVMDRLSARIEAAYTVHRIEIERIFASLAVDGTVELWAYAAAAFSDVGYRLRFLSLAEQDEDERVSLSAIYRLHHALVSQQA